METLFGFYDKAVSEQKIKLKNETLNSPWITKGLQRSSKTKQNYTKTFWEKETKPVKRHMRHIKRYSKHWEEI